MILPTQPIRDVHVPDAEHAVHEYLEGRLDATSLLNRIPYPTLLMSHGAYGLPLYHVAAYVGRDTIVEMTRRRGTQETTLLQTFLPRAETDHRKCPHPSGRVTVYVCYPRPCRPRGCRGLPPYPSVDARVRWLRANPLRYDIRRLNCEHVARYLLTGTCGCRQLDVLEEYLLVTVIVVGCLAALCAR